MQSNNLFFHCLRKNFKRVPNRRRNAALSITYDGPFKVMAGERSNKLYCSIVEIRRLIASVQSSVLHFNHVESTTLDILPQSKYFSPLGPTMSLFVKCVTFRPRRFTLCVTEDSKRGPPILLPLTHLHTHTHTPIDSSLKKRLFLLEAKKGDQ